MISAANFAKATFADDDDPREALRNIVPLTLASEHLVALIAPRVLERPLGVEWFLRRVESETLTEPQMLTDECRPANSMPGTLHHAFFVERITHVRLSRRSLNHPQTEAFPPANHRALASN